MKNIIQITLLFVSFYCSVKAGVPFPDEAVYGDAKSPEGQSVLAAFSVGVRLTAPEFQIYERVKLERLPLPPYPPAMLNIGVYGKCEILFDLNPDGSVSNVRVARSPNPEFAEVAVPAVKGWKLEPVKQRDEGKKIAVIATFIFSIYDGG